MLRIPNCYICDNMASQLQYIGFKNNTYHQELQYCYMMLVIDI